MPVEVPCILASVLGSEIAGGATSGLIRVVANGVAESLPFPAAPDLITLDRHYYVAGDGQADAAGSALVNGRGDLLAMLEAAVLQHTELLALSVDQDGAGVVQFSGANVGFRFDEDHVDTTVDMTIFGLPGSGQTPAVATVVFDAPARHRFGFFPGHYQSEDSLDTRKVVAAVARPISGAPRTVATPLGLPERSLGWEQLDGADVRSFYAAQGGAFEQAFNESIYLGRPWRFYQDTAVRTSSSYATYAQGALDELPWKRNEQDPLVWDVRLEGVRLD